MPYFTIQHTQHELPGDHPALVILDVFAAHCSQAVKKAFQDANIRTVYVPAGVLQSLDVSGNLSSKGFLDDEFSSWYSSQVTDQLHQGVVDPHQHETFLPEAQACQLDAAGIQQASGQT